MEIPHDFPTLAEIGKDLPQESIWTDGEAEESHKSYFGYYPYKVLKHLAPEKAI